LLTLYHLNIRHLAQNHLQQCWPFKSAFIWFWPSEFTKESTQADTDGVREEKVMYLHPPVWSRWRKCKRGDIERSGVWHLRQIFVAIKLEWTTFSFHYFYLAPPKNISGTEYTKKILWLCQQPSTDLNWNVKKVWSWEYCKIDIFLTAVEKKTETKCKDEEDHRFFAERPFSYGDFVLIHLHIIILVVTCCFWLWIKKFANLY